VDLLGILVSLTNTWITNEVNRKRKEEQGNTAPTGNMVSGKLQSKRTHPKKQHYYSGGGVWV
jgi:hypothetical protein